jgi:hypothetical protein
MHGQPGSGVRCYAAFCLPVAAFPGAPIIPASLRQHAYQGFDDSDDSSSSDSSSRSKSNSSSDRPGAAHESSQAFSGEHLAQQLFASVQQTSLRDHGDISAQPIRLPPMVVEAAALPSAAAAGTMAPRSSGTAPREDPDAPAAGAAGLGPQAAPGVRDERHPSGDSSGGGDERSIAGDGSESSQPVHDPWGPYLSWGLVLQALNAEPGQVRVRNE